MFVRIPAPEAQFLPTSATTWISALGSPGALQTLLGQHGPRILTTVLLGCIAVEAGVILTGNLGQSYGVPPTVPAPAAAPQRRGIDLRPIVAAHLFGQAALSSTDAPPTSIPLVLAGVLALQDPSQGMAILGPNPAQAKLYAVGAAVPGGARLHAVYRDRVLLDRSGALEALMLPRKSLVSAPPPAPATPTPGQRLQLLAQNNNVLLGGLIRVVGKTMQNKFVGFTIYPGTRSNPTALAQLGLRSGDTITAINGTPLDDPTRANDVLQTLSSASSAVVTVLRNGAQQDISLNLAAVANEAERAAEEPADADGVGNRPQVER
jgi:general secretion pathway protein C